MNFELTLRLIFSILSIVYIASIFVLAGSPIVRILAPFNFHSLLHIPLYGILTFLLIFSFVPLKMKSINPINPTDSINPINSITRFVVVAVIALGVGIADEIHQAHVPGREASVTDVLLDLVGIILALFFVLLFHKKQKSVKSQLTR